MAAATCFLSSLFFIQSFLSLKLPIVIGVDYQIRCSSRDHLPDFCASAAASWRNFAMVAYEGSFRLPLLARRLGLVL